MAYFLDLSRKLFAFIFLLWYNKNKKRKRVNYKMVQVKETKVYKEIWLPQFRSSPQEAKEKYLDKWESMSIVLGQENTLDLLENLKPGELYYLIPSDEIKVIDLHFYLWEGLGTDKIVAVIIGEKDSVFLDNLSEKTPKELAKEMLELLEKI